MRILTQTIFAAALTVSGTSIQALATNYGTLDTIAPGTRIKFIQKLDLNAGENVRPLLAGNVKGTRTVTCNLYADEAASQDRVFTQDLIVKSGSKEMTTEGEYLYHIYLNNPGLSRIDCQAEGTNETNTGEMTYLEFKYLSSVFSRITEPGSLTNDYADIYTLAHGTAVTFVKPVKAPGDGVGTSFFNRSIEDNTVEYSRSSHTFQRLARCGISNYDATPKVVKGTYSIDAITISQLTNSYPRPAYAYFYGVSYWNQYSIVLSGTSPEQLDCSMSYNSVYTRGKEMTILEFKYLMNPILHVND